MKFNYSKTKIVAFSLTAILFLTLALIIQCIVKLKPSIDVTPFVHEIYHLNTVSQFAEAIKPDQQKLYHFNVYQLLYARFTPRKFNAIAVSMLNHKCGVRHVKSACEIKRWIIYGWNDYIYAPPRG